MSPLFTSLDDPLTITTLRGLTAASLSQTGYRLTFSGSDDGGGGANQTWGTAGTASCRLDPFGGKETTIADRIDENSTHLLTIPASLTIDPKDRFAINGDTYEVTAVRERTHGQIRRIEVVKRT